MKDWFDGAPDWCNVVLECTAGEGATIYLETDEKGVSGSVMILHNGSNAGGLTGTARRSHMWWDAENQDKVVARRPQASTENRYLTEEEVEVLSDLGMLEEALKMQGISMPLPDETMLSVRVWDQDSGNIIYDFHEGIEGDVAATVTEFLDVVETAYQALGFTNKLEINIHNFSGGSVKVIDPKR